MSADVLYTSQIYRWFRASTIILRGLRFDEVLKDNHAVSMSFKLFFVSNVNIVG
jgi:hypothetical protein